MLSLDKYSFNVTSELLRIAKKEAVPKTEKSTRDQLQDDSRAASGNTDRWLEAKDWPIS